MRFLQPPLKLFRARFIQGICAPAYRRQRAMHGLRYRHTAASTRRARAGMISLRAISAYATPLLPPLTRADKMTRGRDFRANYYDDNIMRK